MRNLTILRTYETITDYTWGWSWIGFVLALIALCTLSVMTLFIIRKRRSQLIAGTLALALCISLASYLCFRDAQPVYETYYDAYLSGMINISEFTQTYEIVSQDGLLFTLRDAR